MKLTKVLLATAALAISLGAYSQTNSSKNDSTGKNMRHAGLTESAHSTSQNQQSATTDTTINAIATNPTTGNSSSNNNVSSVPKPNFGRYYIPVLGTYNAVATTANNKSLKVTADENNPGKVWVEGLTGTKFYALLKTVPGTYKIPAQKQENNSIAEGTLIYDENSKQINLCSGCGYNETAPSGIEAIASTEAAPAISKNKIHHQPVAKVKKVSVISFTGTKSNLGTVSLLQ